MERQAGAKEIRRNECTPVMIMAGAEAHAEWRALDDPLYKTQASLLSQVWAAMEAERRNGAYENHLRDPLEH